MLPPAKIIFTAEGSGPFTFLHGANHYRIIGLEVTRDSPGAVVYNLFLPEKDGSLDHVAYDRVWLHGTAQDETNRGIALGGSSYHAVGTMLSWAEETSAKGTRSARNRPILGS